MIYKSVDIIDFGPISKLQHEFRQNDKGNPVPLVLLGKNGSGKTLFLASLVDSYIEIKKRTYTSYIPEIENNNDYYMIMNSSYIKNGADCYVKKFELTFNEKEVDFGEVEYNNKISQEFLKEVGFKNEMIKKFNSNSPCKVVSDGVSHEKFRDEIFVYFPISRGYKGMWQNKSQNNNWYENERISRKANDNCIIYDMGVYIEEYIKDLILDKYAVVETARSDAIINEIIKFVRQIKDCDTVTFSVGERRNRSIGFQWGSDKDVVVGSSPLGQFSSGEITLLSFAINIIKSADLNLNNFDGKFESVRGTVIIDEADMNLHIDMQYNQFPKLMRAFPNVQFIISSHSPFMLAGLKEEFKDDIDFLIMPDGVLCDDLNSFGEITDAYKIFSEKTEEILAENKRLNDELRNIKSEHGIILYTEGKTDKILLDKAMDVLGIKDLGDLKIRTINSDTKNKSNNTELQKLIQLLADNKESSHNKVIALFDRDTDVSLIDNAGTGHNILNETYIKLSDYIYAFALPVPHSRVEIKEISIEHYFKDEEITREDANGRRLFMVKEFYSITGAFVDRTRNLHSKKAINSKDYIKIIELETQAGVTDESGKTQYCISKSQFANNIKDDVENFNNFDFSEFNKIFDIVRNIKNDIQNNIEE